MDEVIELKNYYRIKKIIVTHIDEIWGKSYGCYNELEKELDNILFAYDDMEIIVWKIKSLHSDMDIMPVPKE